MSSMRARRVHRARAAAQAPREPWPDLRRPSMENRESQIPVTASVVRGVSATRSVAAVAGYRSHRAAPRRSRCVLGRRQLAGAMQAVPRSKERRRVIKSSIAATFVVRCVASVRKVRGGAVLRLFVSQRALYGLENAQFPEQLANAKIQLGQVGQSNFHWDSSGWRGGRPTWPAGLAS